MLILSKIYWCFRIKNQVYKTNLIKTQNNHKSLIINILNQYFPKQSNALNKVKTIKKSLK